MSKASINERLQELNWVNIGIVSLFHLGAVAALFAFTWQALAVGVFLWWVTGSLGIGIGYHRLLTHRGYKTPKAVEYFLTFCGALALQGGPLDWVATHRIHHAHADAPGDPHTPRDGGWWSHVLWVMHRTGQHREQAMLDKYVPDLTRDPFHVWLTRLYLLPLVLVGLALLALGGWPYVLWGVFFRVTYGWHATWLVNSATHMWGARRFATRDDSRNSLWVALLTFGEGWHNNHHAHPTSARHGLRWYEIDMNWWGIRALQLLGLARSIKLVNANGTPVNSDPLRSS